MSPTSSWILTYVFLVTHWQLEYSEAFQRSRTPAIIAEIFSIPSDRSEENLVTGSHHGYINNILHRSSSSGSFGSKCVARHRSSSFPLLAHQHHNQGFQQRFPRSVRSKSISTHKDSNAIKRQVTRGSGSRLMLDLQDEDILEDDLDYLNQLRKQMESISLAATPREITNRLKNYFGKEESANLSGGARGKAGGGGNSRKETNDLRDFLERNIVAMDSVNAIMIMEGCARNRINVRSIISWKQLFDAMRKPSALLTSSMIYRGISATKCIGRNEDSNIQRTYVSLLFDRIEESGVILNNADICPAIYSLQNLDPNSQETKKIVSYLTKCVRSTNPDVPFPAKAICSAIYGLKRLRTANSPEVREIVDAIASRIQDSETYFHSVNICIALNGLQHMEDSYPEVRRLMRALMDKAIPAEEQGFDKAGDREISMALFGLQRMGTYVNTDTSSLSEGPLNAAKGWSSSRKQQAQQQHSYTANRARNKAKALETAKSKSSVDTDDESLDSNGDDDAGAGSSGSSRFDTNNGGMVKEGGAAKKGVKGRDDSEIDAETFETFLMDEHSTALLPTTVSKQLTAPAVEGVYLGQGEQGRGVEGGMSTKGEGNGKGESAAAAITSAGSVSVEQEPILTGSNAKGSNVTLELSQILQYLSSLLRHYEEPFEAKRLGFAMLGLSRLSNNIPEVIDLLETLASKAVNAWGEINGQELSMCLHGLMGMESDSPQVIRLLHEVVPLIRRCPTMSAADAKSALSGLQGLHSTSKDANNVCDSFADLLLRSNITFSEPEDISAALHGLQGLVNSESHQARKLVAAVISCIAPLNPSPSSSTTDAAEGGGGNGSRGGDDDGAAVAVGRVSAAAVEAAGEKQAARAWQRRTLTSDDASTDFTDSTDSAADATATLSLIGSGVSERARESETTELEEKARVSERVEEKLNAVLDVLSTSKPANSPRITSAASSPKSNPKLPSGKPVTAYKKAKSWTPRRSFTGREMAMCFYGVRAASNYPKECAQLLTVLTPYVHTLRPGALTCQDVASCLYGMQKLSVGTANSGRIGKSVGDMARALAKQLPSARGTFNPKGVSMAMNGLQGLNSRLSSVRLLIRGLNTLLERSEHGYDVTTSPSAGGTVEGRRYRAFSGFDDFNQLSSALYGLSNSRSDNEEVQRLLVVLERLSHVGRTLPPVNNNSSSTIAAAVSVAVGSGSAEVRGRRLRKISEIPKAEKVAMAFFGLQGMSPTIPAVASLHNLLAAYFEAMPRPNGKVLGMAMQGFRNTVGKLTPAQEKILLTLAEKMRGWSHKKTARGGSGGSVSKTRKPSVEDIQITLRSALSGIQRVDRWNPGVQAILHAVADEMIVTSADLAPPYSPPSPSSSSMKSFSAGKEGVMTEAADRMKGAGETQKSAEQGDRQDDLEGQALEQDQKQEQDEQGEADGHSVLTPINVRTTVAANKFFVEKILDDKTLDVMYDAFRRSIVQNQPDSVREMMAILRDTHARRQRRREQEGRRSVGVQPQSTAAASGTTAGNAVVGAGSVAGTGAGADSLKAVRGVKKSTPSTGNIGVQQPQRQRQQQGKKGVSKVSRDRASQATIASTVPVSAAQSEAVPKEWRPKN